MLAEITMVDNTCHEVEFSDCEDINEIREWLNSSRPFVSISNHTVLNIGHIVMIKESGDDESEVVQNDCVANNSCETY